MDINYKANISNEIENKVVINDQEIEIKDEQFKYDKGNTVEKEKKRKRKKALQLYFSSKHTVYLITLWLVFLLSFIILLFYRRNYQLVLSFVVLSIS